MHGGQSDREWSHVQIIWVVSYDTLAEKNTHGCSHDGSSVSPVSAPAQRIHGIYIYEDDENDEDDGPSVEVVVDKVPLICDSGEENDNRE